MFLSIIIPAYNVEKYVERCVYSILNQKVEECEIIIVDDGSTDRTLSICKDFEGYYANVKVFHKENGGLSSARNFGLDIAVGKYIMFVDSDDFLIDNSLKCIIKDLIYDPCDIWTGRVKTITDEGITKDKVEYTLKRGKYSIDFYAKYCIKHRKMIEFCAQYFVYDREFIKNNELKFRCGIIHEDELWTSKVLLSAKTIFVSDMYFYMHYTRMGSIMHSNNKEKSAYSYLIVCLELKDILAQDHIEKYRDNLINDRIATYFLLAALQSNCKFVEFSKIGRLFPLKASRSFTNTIKSILYAISPMGYCAFYKKYKIQSKKIK